LFEAKEKSEARRLAEHLDKRNTERKEAQREIFNRAIEEFESGAERAAQTHAAVIAGDGWHRGVIGLAASKIAERLHRPCVVISLDGDVGHGSARSIEAYHLFDGLTVCRDLLDKFGGHSHAAGLAIRREHIPEFRRRLNEHAASCLTEEDLEPVVAIDAEVASQSLGFQLAQDLSALASESFDVALFLGPLYHIVEPEKRSGALRELNRILKPDGTAIIAYLNSWGLIKTGIVDFPNRYRDISTLRAMLSENTKRLRCPIWCIAISPWGS